MNTGAPIIRNEGEGERRWFYGGGVHTWKASSGETAGALMLFEDQMSRGKATPLHIHADEDEALYVLEGELLVRIDGKNHRVGPCGFVFAPRGVPHAFLVTSPQARLLCWQTPASAEAFYRDASERADPERDLDGPVDFARVIAAAKQTGGMQVVGPPPSANPNTRPARQRWPGATTARERVEPKGSSGKTTTPAAAIRGRCPVNPRFAGLRATDALIDANEETERPHDQSGDGWQRPTTGSSSTITRSRLPPPGRQPAQRFRGNALSGHGFGVP